MKQLTKREIFLLKIMGIVAFLVIIYLFVLEPLLITKSNKQTVNNDEDNVLKLKKITSEYIAIQRKKTDYESILGNKQDNINSLIQSWAQTYNIENKIAYTKRKQSNKLNNQYIQVNTDVKINGASIKDLLKFIESAENTNGVFVNYMNIKQGLKTKEEYDALIKITTFVKK